MHECMTVCHKINLQCEFLQVYEVNTAIGHVRERKKERKKKGKKHAHAPEIPGESLTKT